MKPDVIIILSAARSGSKLLRDLLGASSEVDTIPYDINYIWKHGNYSVKHDLLTPDLLSPRIKKYIRKKIYAYNKSPSAQLLVEKTVSNTLRVEYVKSVFPNARFIHLVRDGRDVSMSAKRRWEGFTVSRENQPHSVYLKKILKFPFLTAAPYFASKVREHFTSQVHDSVHPPIWGPRFKGMRDYLDKHTLAEVCAYQWDHSVTCSLEALSDLSLNQEYINVRFEDLLADTGSELKRISDFCGIEDAETVIQNAKTTIKHVSREHDVNEVKTIMPILRSSLETLGYLSSDVVDYAGETDSRELPAQLNHGVGDAI